MSDFPQPYYKDEYCMLYKGNALDVLRKLPSDSISCVITSPPFYQCISYGEETIVTWDGDENCKHEWDSKPLALISALLTKGLPEQRYVYDNDLHYDKPVAHIFCLKCGAWRGQLGNEPSVDLFMSHLLSIFSEVKRVLRPDGTCFVELGDSYGSSRGNAEKSLLCVPFRFAIGMTDMGFLLRNTIINRKRSCLPNAGKDRFTVDFSYLFFFTKNRDYWFRQQFEPSLSGNGFRTKRAVWEVRQRKLREEHYAPFSTTLVETPISAGCPECVCRICNRPRNLVVKKEYLAVGKHGRKYHKIYNFDRGPLMTGFKISDVYYDDCDCVAEDKWRPGIVLDPFSGSGTTGVVAIKQRKFYIGIELSSKFIDISLKRIAQVNLSQKTQDSITEKKPLQRMLF